MDSCPVRAEQVLEGHGRPLRATLSRPSDWAKYETALDVALHFGPEDHSCAEKLNKNNDQVGRETLPLFKSGQAAVLLHGGRDRRQVDLLVQADRLGLKFGRQREAAVGTAGWAVVDHLVRVFRDATPVALMARLGAAGAGLLPSLLAIRRGRLG